MQRRQPQNVIKMVRKQQKINSSGPSLSLEQLGQDIDTHLKRNLDFLSSDHLFHYGTNADQERLIQTESSRPGWKYFNLFRRRLLLRWSRHFGSTTEDRRPPEWSYSFHKFMLYALRNFFQDF
jgi:hypothetical protein